MKQLFIELGRFFQNPFESIAGIVESFGAWSASRSWWRIMPILPLVLVVLIAFAYATLTTSVGGSSRIEAYLDELDERMSLGDLEGLLYRDYVKLDASVQNDAPENLESTGESANASDKELVSPDDDSLRRMQTVMERILQIDPQHDDAKYRLAIVETMLGNRDKADSLISELTSRVGLPHLPGDHWHAINLINRRVKGERITDVELESVLQRANEWRNATFDVRLAYADLLLRLGKSQEAIVNYDALAVNRPDLHLRIAAIAKASKNESAFRQATSKAEKYYADRMRSSDSKPVDRIGYAQALLYNERADVAKEVLSSGIQNSTREEPELRRALANVYINEFVQPADSKDALDAIDDTTTDKAAENATGDITLLERAAEIDPLNPQLGRMIAVLATANDKEAKVTTALTDVLSQQLKARTMAPDTLLILGGMYYQKGKLAQAESFWERAVELQPNLSIALNNLAFLQIEKEQPNKERALELIERAYKLAPTNIEILDSYGQILLAVEQPIAALGKLEAVLRMDPTRTKTRSEVAKAYEMIGMNDVSEAELKFIASMNTKNDSTTPSDAASKSDSK